MTDIIQEKKKINKHYRFLSIIWAIIPFSLLEIISSTILMGIDESNTNIPWIFVIIGIILFILSLILGITFSLLNNHRRHNIFDKEEKERFLNSYLISELVSFFIIFVGFCISVLGIWLKNLPGQITSATGLIVLGVGLGYFVFKRVERIKYRERRNLNDIIKEKGLYASLSILERFIILILTIVIFILTFFQLKEKQTMLFEIIYFTVIFKMYILIAYFIIRLIYKLKKK